MNPLGHTAPRAPRGAGRGGGGGWQGAKDQPVEPLRFSYHGKDSTKECTMHQAPGGVVGDTLACASAAGVAVLFDVPEALFTGAAAALGRT